MTSWRTSRRTRKHYPRITGIGGGRQDEFLSARDNFAKWFTKSQDAFAKEHVKAREDRARDFAKAREALANLYYNKYTALALKQSQERTVVRKTRPYSAHGPIALKHRQQRKALGREHGEARSALRKRYAK